MGLRSSETCYRSLGCGDRSHGTAVAGVIAARRDNTLIFDPPEDNRYNFHGVAWGIDRLDMLSIPLGSGGGGNYHGNPGRRKWTTGSTISPIGFQPCSSPSIS